MNFRIGSEGNIEITRADETEYEAIRTEERITSGTIQANEIVIRNMGTTWTIKADETKYKPIKAEEFLKTQENTVREVFDNLEEEINLKDNLDDYVHRTQFEALQGVVARLSDEVESLTDIYNNLNLDD